MARKPQTLATVYLRVLGYIEDGDWVAHCLETDLVGIGGSFASAMKELRRATSSQMGFANFKGQPSLFHRPAPLHIVESYSHLLAARLERPNEPSANPTRAISGFSLPPANKGRYALASDGV